MKMLINHLKIKLGKYKTYVRMFSLFLLATKALRLSRGIALLFLGPGH